MKKWLDHCINSNGTDDELLNLIVERFALKNS